MANGKKEYSDLEKMAYRNGKIAALRTADGKIKKSFDNGRKAGEKLLKK